jgi:glycosyltransferase involved in cell wall biosynthesis
MRYKVAIITSLYKAEKYLAHFLKNITSQTIFSDCCLYLMNGNSPQNEYEIVRPFVRQYSNIIYQKLSKDPGIYGCWNLAIQQTDSEYITNANVDDRLFPSAIERHISVLDNNKDIDVAYCYNIESTVPNVEPLMLNGQHRLFTTAEFSIDNMIKANLPHNHPVWRRSLHEEFGYYNTEDYVSASDWDFFLKCAIGGIKMKLIPEVLGVYYNNPEGMSTKDENMERNLQEVQDIRSKYTILTQSER